MPNPLFNAQRENVQRENLSPNKVSGTVSTFKALSFFCSVRRLFFFCCTLKFFAFVSIHSCKFSSYSKLKSFVNFIHLSLSTGAPSLSFSLIFVEFHIDKNILSINYVQAIAIINLQQLNITFCIQICMPTRNKFSLCAVRCVCVCVFFSTPV